MADASHELRTPVASIRTNVEVLQRSGDGLPAEERAEILSEVVATTGEMSLLIADLLEVARHEETSGPADRVRLDEEVLAAVEQSRQTHPTVTVSVDAEQSTVVGTAPRVRRAVLNLVDNAAKWSPPGGTVEVTVRGTTVTVRDHGPGIPPDDLDRVFDRFLTVGHGTRSPGIGARLAIVRQVAEDHGGTVEAADTGRGALFTLRLPDPGCRTAGSGFLYPPLRSVSWTVLTVRVLGPPRGPSAKENRDDLDDIHQPTDDPPPEVPEPASPRKASARTWVAAGAVAALVVVVGVVMMGGGGGGEADTAGMPTGNDEADAAGFGPAGAAGRGAFGEVTAVAGPR